MGIGDAICKCQSGTCAVASICGDGSCDTAKGETPANCPKDCQQAKCQIIDVYAQNVPGYVYSNFYLSVSNFPSAATPRGYSDIELAGADTWNGLTFTPKSTSGDSTTLQATQTVNAQGVAFIMARKNNLSLTLGGTTYCTTNPATPVCGNGICENGESAANCSKDCGITACTIKNNGCDYVTGFVSAISGSCQRQRQIVFSLQFMNATPWALTVCVACRVVESPLVDLGVKVKTTRSAAPANSISEYPGVAAEGKLLTLR